MSSSVLGLIFAAPFLLAVALFIGIRIWWRILERRALSTIAWHSFAERRRPFETDKSLRARCAAKAAMLRPGE
jgi:hypothetical protein